MVLLPTLVTSAADFDSFAPLFGDSSADGEDERALVSPSLLMIEALRWKSIERRVKDA